MAVKDIVVFLDKLGMWDIIIPFILVFTIVYATLEKTKVLGEENGEPKHRFNAIAAFVIAFFTLLAVDVMNLVTRFSQYMVVLLVMALLMAVLFGFFGLKDIGQNKLGKKILIPILFICFVLGILYAFGWLNIIDWSAIYGYSGVLIALVVFFLVIWIILREPKKTTTPAAPAPAAPAPKKEKKPEGFKVRTMDELNSMSPEEREEYLNEAQKFSKEEFQEMAKKQGLQIMQ